ncbi:MAG: ribonuclease R [Bacilli bacterium]|nr:ribonuclease R [Bacilli bacterium]MDD3895751.1 ribonuclease R [Bacilli bacterium]MDD4407590.1 ribonuclease R [Bacilli bacterium]
MKKEVINILNDKKDALDIIVINDLLNLKTSDQLKELQTELDNLIKEHILYKTKKDKYILYKNLSNIKVGKLSINKQGNGFLLLDEDDLYINYNNLNNATNGDIVLAETFLYNNKIEGKIIKILERNTNNLIGTIYFNNNEAILKLDDDRKKIDIILEKNSLDNCVDGTKVLINTTKELGNNRYYGRVIKIIGHKDDPTVDIKTIAYKYNFFEEFSKEAMNQTNNIPEEVNEKDLINRKDLTKEIIMTIDGDDTKDIDDALSFKYENGIYHLGVHIADVSNYVTKDSPLDIDAFQRGTSSYLANSVIPMLPHKLSNGICSLNPDVIRLTISCVMQINEKGNVIDYDIFPSYIKSQKRMTYKKVNDILMRNIVAEDYKEFEKTLKEMNKLAKILRQYKINRGYIDFDIDEPKLIIDEKGKCIGVERREREDGEKLIEDFMIAANETVATHISNMNLPFIYRVHGTPKPDRIDSFIQLVNLMGYKLIGKFTDLKPSSMQKILSQLNDKPEFDVLSSILLRSMQKAVYSSENIGHFGLGSKCYTHFTSPIRRYPDLIVHRLLKDFIFESKIDNETIKKWETILPEIGIQTSLREQESVEAEREVDDMKMAEYMESHIGEIYNGIISGVTMFGFFVQLENLIEGLVHVNTLKGDYYNYVPELMSLIGSQSKKKYRLGDKVTIKVIAASKEAKTIDFDIIGDDNNGNK